MFSVSRVFDKNFLSKKNEQWKSHSKVFRGQIIVLKAKSVPQWYLECDSSVNWVSNLYLYFFTTVNDSSNKKKRNAAAFINRAATKATSSRTEESAKLSKEPASSSELNRDTHPERVLRLSVDHIREAFQHFEDLPDGNFWVANSYFIFSQFWFEMSALIITYVFENKNVKKIESKNSQFSVSCQSKWIRRACW